MEIAIENKRFKEIRQELKYTQADFADLLGESQSTADIERGKTKLSGKIVMELLHQFHINPLWLYGISEKKKLNPQQADVLPKTLTLNEEGGENILLVHQKAAAGYGAHLEDSRFLEQLPVFTFPLPNYRNASFRGFEITGDSMIPLVYSEDWVLAKSVGDLSDVIDDKIYVVVERDNIRLKKVRLLDRNTQMQLISLNPDYPPTKISTAGIVEMWEYHSRISFGIERIQGLTLQKVYDEVKELKRNIGKD